MRVGGEGTGFKESIRRFKDIGKRWERNFTLNSEEGERVQPYIKASSGFVRGRVGLLGEVKGGRPSLTSVSLGEPLQRREFGERTGTDGTRLLEVHELASTIRGHVAVDRNNMGTFAIAL